MGKFTINTSDEEKKIISGAAHLKGKTPGRYARQAVLEQAVRDLKRNGVSVDKPTIRKYGEDK